MSESHEVPVLSGSSEQSWILTMARRGRDWLLTLLSPGGGHWTAEGPDLFKALRELRRIVDPLGIRLGVNGARRDSWASGMQCDMGEGRVVYILREGQAAGPAQVPTLGTTALADIGTVEEQDEQYARWLDSRRIN
jgi:hypothetical protein